MVVALLLLVVITIVGFAAVRGTIVQQKLASNMFDRQVAFQSAEAALRAASDLLETNPNFIARDCQSSGVICPGNPFSDPNLPSGSIHDVSPGSAAGQYTPGAAASGKPQFVIESMGQWADPNSSTGFGQTANSHNAGVQGTSTTATYYRITARSGDPEDASSTENRAIVTLQAVVKRG
ncbi:pilus assembly protein [Oleiagrimonas sp. MCCC 1A03011]|nr:pilus assembly protein [Oleiagrimonas sp. MCCC 1A03011]